jgi:anti-sigma factor RsiW
MDDISADDLACVEAVELVTDYLEGTLSPAEVRRLEHHLETCSGCDEYVEQMRSLAGSLGDLSSDSLAAERRERVIAAFRRGAA